jgi:hypothetical protein
MVLRVPLADIAGSEPSNPVLRAFLNALRRLGWNEGNNLTIERHSTDGQPNRGPAIFADMLARGVDLIFVGGTDWANMHDPRTGC